ncbi:MAG: redoxin domain-containing protein [Myxococcales bacterium]|nr:redoxin domain-containing protein [Myxococcales bacterium]
MRWTLLAGLLTVACDSDDSSVDTCDPSSDLDADGLDDCAEEALGTSPENADSDGDGVDDGDEVACVSSPLDADEVCYECGWPHRDEIVSDRQGSEIGDTLRNVTMPDQCGERVDLHDLAGAYRILFMTTQWCASCVEEARELRTRSRQFERETSIPFSYVITVFQDTMGAPPTRDVAADYADHVDARRVVPVLADVDQDLLVDTPYDGNALPGKCVLSPQMEMLDCYTGHGDDAEAFAMIEAHASNAGTP